MKTSSVSNFNKNYQSHLKHLRNKGLQPKTIEAYSLAIIMYDGGLVGGLKFQITRNVAPVNQPFDTFTIDKAKVKLGREAGQDRFKVRVSFVLGVNSDGIDVLNEDVTVTFDGFTETVPAGSFSRDLDDDDKSLYRSQLEGITHIDLWDDGSFRVKAKDIDLSGIDFNDVLFSLQIGDDIGTTNIIFDNKGEFKPSRYNTLILITKGCLRQSFVVYSIFRKRD